MKNEIIQTKQEFKSAIKRKQNKIIVEGKLAEQLNKVSVIKNVDTIKLMTIFGVGIGVAIVPIGAPLTYEMIALSLSIGQNAASTLLILVSAIGLLTLLSAYHDYDYEYNVVNQIPTIIFQRKQEKNKEESLNIQNEYLIECKNKLLFKEYEYVQLTDIYNMIVDILVEYQISPRLFYEYQFIHHKSKKMKRLYFIGKIDFGYFDLENNKIEVIEYDDILDACLNDYSHNEFQRTLELYLKDNKKMIIDTPIFHKSYLFMYLQYQSDHCFIDNDKLASECQFNSYHLDIGDVLEVKRKKLNIGVYSHFAIYLGNDKVIQFSGEGKDGRGDFKGKISIRISDFKNFILNDDEFNVLKFEDEKNTLQNSFIHNSINYTSQNTVINILGHIFNIIVPTVTMMLPLGISINVLNMGKIARNLASNKEFMKKEKDFHIYTPEETIQRAKSRLGEEHYNLLTNNCEHFALWCKTGISESFQVEKVFGLTPVNKKAKKMKYKK